MNSIRVLRSGGGAVSNLNHKAPNPKNPEPKIPPKPQDVPAGLPSRPHQTSKIRRLSRQGHKS